MYIKEYKLCPPFMKEVYTRNVFTTQFLPVEKMSTCFIPSVCFDSALAFGELSRDHNANMKLSQTDGKLEFSFSLHFSSSSIFLFYFLVFRTVYEPQKSFKVTLITLSIA